MQETRIRRLVPEDMRRYIEIYLQAYPAGKDLSEDCFEKYYKRNLESLTDFPEVNFFGCFEEDELVAIMKLIDFEMNLFGKMGRGTGLMSLAVHPLYKKRGIAKEMVGFFEGYALESGSSVAMLLPFRMDYYRRLGYGYGTKMDEYRLPMTSLPSFSKREAKEFSAGLQLLGKGDIDRMLACHRRFCERNHGAVCKFGEEIRDLRSDDNLRHLGYLDPKGDLRGYAAFYIVNDSDCNYTLNFIDVRELVFEDPQTLRALIYGIGLQSDLAGSLVLRSGEADFVHLLFSAQDRSGNYMDFGFLQTNLSAIGTMYKLPNPELFVEKTAHRKFVLIGRETLSLGFRFWDEMQEEERSFAVDFERGQEGFAGWKISQKAAGEADVCIETDLAALSSLLMGSAELSALCRLGVLTLSRPEMRGILEALFHPEQRPFTNTDY